MVWLLINNRYHYNSAYAPSLEKILFKMFTGRIKAACKYLNQHKINNLETVRNRGFDIATHFIIGQIIVWVLLAGAV